MTGATTAPVVSVAAAPGFHGYQNEPQPQTLPDTWKFQGNAGPTVLEPELAASREGTGLFFVVYFIKISFLFLFILMDTSSRYPRGTQVGPYRTLQGPGAGRVYFHRLLSPQGCL